MEADERVMDHYAAVDAGWPAAIPPITREEARRASRKLARHFGGRPRREPRRCWVATSGQVGTIRRGWRRLVHDVSHRVWREQAPAARGHGKWHADLEREMVAYVVARGWLAGTLRAPEKATPVSLDARRAKRALHLAAQVAKWTRRKKLATTKLRYWTNRERAAARRQAEGVQG